MFKRFFQKLHKSLDKRPAIFMIILSCTLNCFIELMGRRSIISLVTHLATRPHIFLLNSAIIMCTFLLAIFAIRRAFAVLMISSFWIVCGVVNFAIITFRASPFTARDILLVGYGLRIADVYLPPLLMILIVVALVAIAFGTIIAFIKLPRIKSRPKLTRIIGLSIPILAVLALLTRVVSGSKKLESNGVLEAYDEFGFAYCFASSLLSSGIDKPENYSLESVSGILSYLEAENPAALPRPPALANIVFIQLESFIDPTMIECFASVGEPVPVFSHLKETRPSGYLYVPVVGGGTANVEFEVLTGLSSRLFALGECPYESILRKRGCESIAFNLKELGYTATAIHNHNGTFYSRNTVYSSLGFDRFVPLEFMHGVEYTPVGWAKDKVLADYIVECLDMTEGPDLVFAVSVQGHGKYPDDFDDYAFESSAAPELGYLSPGAIEYYISQLSETDAFIGDLIDTFEDSDEDIALILYGDHLPAISLTEDLLVTGSLYQTEYVIWSNFDIDAGDQDLYSYELSAYVLELLNIDSGVITKLHQSNDYLSVADEALMTLGYDMLYGENYVNDGEDVYTPSELEMGLDDICVENVYIDDGYSYIEGDNFTEYSVANVNGQRVETEYMSEDMLRSPYIPNPDDVITVTQSGPDRVDLSSTDEYVYGDMG